MYSSHLLKAVLLILSALACVSHVIAAPVISVGASVQTDENLMFGDNGGPLVETGTTVSGKTNNTSIFIDITSNEGLILNTPASGQQRVELDGFSSSHLGFGDVTIDPEGTFAMTAAQFNLKILDQISGYVKLTLAGTGFSTFTTGTFAVTNGSNWFGIVAGPGEFINSITIQSFQGSDASRIIENLGQIRVSGVNNPLTPTSGGTSPVHMPEPASLLTWSLIGGAAGLAAWRSRRKKLAA